MLHSAMHPLHAARGTCRDVTNVWMAFRIKATLLLVAFLKGGQAKFVPKTALRFDRS